MTDDGKSCAAIRAELAEARGEASTLREAIGDTIRDRADARRERDALRAELDALKAPIAGIEELGRIGWEAWQRAAGHSLRPRVYAEDKATDAAEAQAIASRLIGALRAAFIEASGHGAGLYTQYFDRAVKSLKFEIPPEPTKAPTDTRPVVKVGQVWRDERDGQVLIVTHPPKGEMAICRVQSGQGSDGDNSAVGSCTELYLSELRFWHLVTDASEPVKVEPFKLKSSHCLSYWGQLETELTTVRERLAKLEAVK